MAQWLSDMISPSLQNRISLGVQLFMFLVSAIVMGAIVVDYGFVLDAREMSVIHHIYHYGWWIYLLLYISQLIFQWRTITRKTVFMTVVIGLLLLVSVLSKYFSSSSSFKGSEKDLEFYDITCKEEYLSLESGQFLILYPHDAHKPSITKDSKKTVKKVVVKVAI